MEDADDMEADMEGDGDGDAEEDENGDDNGDEDQDEDDDEADMPLSQMRRTNGSSGTGTPTGINGSAPTSHPHPTLIRTSASPMQSSVPASPKLRFEVRAEALAASSYDIVPTIAAPHSTSINAITATPDMRYWFSGGSDCYIRKYDGVASVNGKTLLTVAQRHPFVDSVVKAGVLMSYWDNEDPLAKNTGEEPSLSPVYSLAVQSEALWMLSGLDSGAINLHSVRHDEGKRITYLHKHTNAVSVLTLSKDEKSVLSGSWDKKIYDWDLNTGQMKRSFEESGGQISAIEIRPASSLPVPEDSGDMKAPNGTLSSNGDKPVTNGVLTNGTHGLTNGFSVDGEGNEDAPGDTDSLFGDSLFGEADAVGAPSGGNFGDDEDEFSKALEIGTRYPERVDQSGDLVMSDVDAGLTIESSAPAVQPPQSQTNGVHAQSSATLPSSSLPKAGDLEPSGATAIAETQDALATSDSTFLAASIDGSLRIWDRRQPNPVARILPRSGVPPWCMTACWSPDGNFIYAGRRNGTVEEYGLHKGLKAPERTFKFPMGSGAVTAMRAMPNGRHLIWYILIYIFPPAWSYVSAMFR